MKHIILSIEWIEWIESKLMICLIQCSIEQKMLLSYLKISVFVSKFKFKISIFDIW